MEYNPVTTFREVLREEGVLLELTVRPAHTASFTWGTVNIPPEDIEKGEDFFSAQVRHEVGHRVVPYAPSTVERGIAAREVAKEEGVQDTHSFLNVVYDLMVDGRNLARNPGVYRPYMEYYTEMYLSSPDPRMRLLGEVGKLLLGQKSQNKTAKGIYDLLFRDGRRFYIRLREAARILKPLFSGSEEQQYGAYGSNPAPREEQDGDGGQNGQGNDETGERGQGSGGGESDGEDDTQEGANGENTRGEDGATGQPGEDEGKGGRPTLANMTNAIEVPTIEDAGDIDLVDLARELQDAAVEVRNPSGNPHSTGRRLFLTQQRLRLLDKFVEVTEKMGNRASTSEISEVWRIGDDPTKLDLVDTIQRHGIAIPGVTTLKRGVGSLAGTGKAGAVMLMLDNSGSTKMAFSPSNKTVIDTIREAAFCITETARRNGDWIGAVAFGDGIHWLESMSNIDYETLVDRIIEMEGNSNNTILTEAVNWVLDQIGGKPYGVTTFLITDGDVHDLSMVRSELEEIHRQGKLVIFLIKHPAQPPSNMDEYTNKGFTVYQIDAGTEFSEDALVELDEGE